MFRAQSRPRCNDTSASISAARPADMLDRDRTLLSVHDHKILSRSQMFARRVASVYFTVYINILAYNFQLFFSSVMLGRGLSNVYFKISIISD